VRRGVELQLDVSGSADEGRASASQTLERLDAGRVDGHEVGQIELHRTRVGTSPEQFRDLRHSQPTGETHDASISFLHQAYPAVHGDSLWQD
jgi:hypothetical protein